MNIRTSNIYEEMALDLRSGVWVSLYGAETSAILLNRLQ